MRFSRRELLRGAGASAMALPFIATDGLSQSTSVIKLVVGFAPGGIDAEARLLATPWQTLIGKSVIVDNRPGAGSTIGVRSVIDSPADGSVGLYSPSTGIVVAPAVYKSRPYNPRTDLTPVIMTTRGAAALVVSGGSDVQSVSDLKRLGVQRPGGLNYGSSGAGGVPHLNGYQLGRALGVNAVHVPYKGGALAISDLIAGRIDYLIDALGLLRPMIESGSLRALGVTGERRNAAFPNLPTLEEVGVSGMGASWSGIFLPPKTPAAIVAQWEQTIRQALQDPAVIAGVHARGSEVGSMDRVEFTAFVAAEADRWEKLIREINIEID